MVHEPYSAPPWWGVPLLVGTCRGRHPPQHTMRRSFPEQELVPQDSPPSGRWSMSRAAPFCRPSCLPSALKTHPQHGGTSPLGWVYQPPPVGGFLPHPKPGPGPCKTGGVGMDHRALLFKSRGDVANRPTEVMWAGCYKCGIDPNMGLRHGMGAGEARIHSIDAQPQRILRILIVSK